MKRPILVLYSAAAVAFGASFVRDWAVIHRVADFKDLFGAMYAVAFSSSFVVNEITFRSENMKLRRGDLLAILASTALSAAIMWGSGIDRLGLILLCLPLPALYIVGASASRVLLDHSRLFLARFRDGMTSVAMAGLILLGMQVPALVLATFAVTLLYLGLARQLGAQTAAPAEGVALANPAPARRSWMSSMLYSNLALALLTLWALFTNNHGPAAWGQPASVVVRFSMYGFQILCIPAFLVVRLNVPPRMAPALQALIWGGIAAMAIFALLPLEWASVGVPLAALVALYASLTYMRAAHLAAGGRA